MADRWGKAWMLAVLALVLAAVVSCSGDAKPANEKTGDTGVTRGGGERNSNVKLTLWHWKIGFDPGLKAVAHKFQADTGITVETQAITPDQSYIQLLLAAAAAGTLPDIYLYWSTAGAGAAALNGAAANLQPELAADPQWRDSFLPGTLEAVTITQANIDSWQASDTAAEWYRKRQAGDLFNIPIDIGTHYMVYANVRLLKQAGIPVEAPASMEAWMADMKRAKSKLGLPALTFGGKHASVYQSWLIDLVDYMKNGPQSFTALMEGKEKMSSPKHRYIGDFIEALANDELLVPGVTRLDIDQSDQLFANGQTVYTFGGTFTYASLLEMGMNPADIFIFRVPPYELSTHTQVRLPLIPLTSAAVSDQGLHKKEAIQFVKFLTSQEGQLLYANAAVSVPAIRLEDPSLLNPVSRELLDYIGVGDDWWRDILMVVEHVWNPQWHIYYNELQNVMLGRSTSAKANALFDRLLEENNGLD